jgi:deoxyribodipyrimidine photo-lyase
LVWFRGKDLRVADHLPLVTAIRGGEAIPVFVVDPYFFAPERARRLAHRMQFLLESLAHLEQTIDRLGSRLFLVEGKSTEVIPRLARLWRVDRVLAQRWTEPFGRERDRRVAASLGVPFELLGGETLLPPETLRTGAGKPYSVFTRFARAFAEKAAEVGTPLAAPRSLPPPPAGLSCRTANVPELAQLTIQPNARLARGGESAAMGRLRAFLGGPLATYDEDRDRMDLAGTSGLSADLKFGTISPRSVWSLVLESTAAERSPLATREFCRQLVWREFAHATLWDRPDLLERPFRAGYEGFPWRDDEGDWRAWASGSTGYPVVDAAARQLLAEGIVHNRARMVAASFLAKQLLFDFRRGEAHYLAHLVDGDWANNDLGWQWSAGSGCDAQPYFRIFNPTLQGERFDPEGTYVRRWIPELARLPNRFVHRPWEAPRAVLDTAGVVLGKTYPRPCVDHAVARDRFLRVARAHLRQDLPRAARA